MIGHGGLRLEWASYRTQDARVLLAASGAYQLTEVLRAAKRLRDRNVPNLVVYWLEPGRLQEDCSGTEYAVRDDIYRLLQPPGVPTVFCTHTRTHSIWGLLGPRMQDGDRLSVLGYRNQGGTLDTPGMLFVNRCTWAHCVAEAARLLRLPQQELLDEGEIAALAGRAEPQGVIVPHPLTM
jgi:phosphoketolase